MQIQIDRQGQQFGPYTMEQVQQYLADGTLLPTDFAWHEGLSGWVPLSELVGAGAVRSSATGGSKAAIIKIVAIVALVAGLGVGGYFLYPTIAGWFSGGTTAAGDKNGTKTASDGWETMPNGAPIVGGADLIAQIKVGEIFNSPMAQQELMKSPEAGDVIATMQQLAGIAPGDLQDLTVSLSGLTSTLLTNPDGLDNAFKSGEIKIGLALRTTKAIDKANIEKLVTQGEDNSIEEKTHNKAKYFLFKNENPDEPAFAAYLADDKTLVAGLETVVQSHIDNADKLSTRSGLEFLDTQQQILIALLPTDTTAISSKIDEGLEEMSNEELPPQLLDPAKKGFEALKKFEAIALSGGMSANSLALTVAARFADGESAKSFADNFNTLITEAKKMAQQDQSLAQAFLSLQAMGIQIPQANSTETQAKLAFNLPKQALDSFIAENSGGGNIGPGGGGTTRPGGGNTDSAKHTKETIQRWAILSQSASRGFQGINFQAVQQNLGQPSKQTQNVTMNTRTVQSAGAVIPAARNSPQVQGCIRWDYWNDPQGQRAIYLYFYNGSLVGVQWFESGGRKIGLPGASGGGGTRPGGGGTRPGGGGTRPGGGGTRPGGGGVRPGGSVQLQSAAQAQQLLKGTWVNTIGSRTTLTFGDNNKFGTDAGSGPKTGKYGILGASGPSVQFWGLARTNIANIILKNANEFTVKQTSMAGVIPRGTFRRK